MEVDTAFNLISRAIDLGQQANGYLIVGDLRYNCAELIDRILKKLFPDAIAQIDSKSHPDVAWLSPEGAKRIIKVDSMRERIVAPLSATSYSGGWKVGVILGADRMEAPSANAFLKSLEEPTPQTIYLLATDQPDAILPTIVSRSQRIDLPLSEGILEGDVYDAVSAAFAAKNAGKLAAIIEGMKGESEDEEIPFVRKSFYKTLMSFVRRLMLKNALPAYQAFRNNEAIEEAYRQSNHGLKEEAVLSFLIDRIVFPKER